MRDNGETLKEETINGITYRVRLVPDEISDGGPWGDDQDSAEGNYSRFITNTGRYMGSFGFGRKARVTLANYTQGAENLAEVMRNIRKSLPGKGWSLYPVNAYIHSGIALSLGRGYPFDDPWDSGLGGILCLRSDDPKGNFKARIRAEAYVEYMNQALSGDVYGYIVDSLDLNDGNYQIRESDRWDELDSCWGFYGHEYAKTEALSILEWHTNNAKKVQGEQLAMEIAV